MKKMLLVMFTLIVSGNIFGQYEAEYRKPVILINYFKRTGSINSVEVEKLRNSIIKEASSIKRFNTIDIAEESSLSNESKRRMREEMISDELVRNQEMSQLGANYILDCTVTDISVEKSERKNKEGEVKVSYTAKLEYSIHLLSTEDGTVIYSKVQKNTRTEKTSGEARRNVFVGKLDCEFTNVVAPLEGQLVESDFQVKGNKMESCYIMLGDVHGVEKDDIFEVQTVKYVAGQPLYEKVGALKVVNVYDKISECKVRNGSKKDLFKAMKAYLKLKTESTMEVSPMIAVSDCRGLLDIF